MTAPAVALPSLEAMIRDIGESHNDALATVQGYLNEALYTKRMIRTFQHRILTLEQNQETMLEAIALMRKAADQLDEVEEDEEEDGEEGTEEVEQAEAEQEEQAGAEEEDNNGDDENDDNIMMLMMITNDIVYAPDDD